MSALDAYGFDDDGIDLDRTPAERAEHRLRTEQPWPWSGAALSGDGSMPKPLGHSLGTYFYWSPTTRQVVDLTANGHTPAALMTLAPLQWWELEFPGKGKEGGVDWKAAVNFLLQRNAAVGIFDERRLAGRGVFHDGGRVVANFGDAVCVDGTLQGSPDLPAMGVHGSRLIYQAGRELPRTDKAGLSDEDAIQLSRALELASWSTADMGRLLAGWLAIAPMCGALNWRSHGWLVGERGSGKSYLLDFCGDLLGQFAIRAQGATTEAGLRQDLASDALPVIFDEADPKTEAAGHRLDAILELARQASSSNSAPILKGGASGRSMRFAVRSTFLFASINHALTLAADQSRVIVMTLDAGPAVPSAEERRRRAEQFAALKRALEPLREPEYGMRLFRRTLRLLPTIRGNAEAFAVALAERTGSRRLGDTLGGPLAGWLSLASERAIDKKQAAKLLDDWRWLGGAVERSRTLADHDHALRHLLATIIRPTAGSEFSVGEAIADDGSLGETAAWGRSLARRGIRLDREEGRRILRLANGHQALTIMFAGTPWARTWRETLAQHPAASTTGKAARFAGQLSRCVALDLDVVEAAEADAGR